MIAVTTFLVVGLVGAIGVFVAVNAGSSSSRVEFSHARDDSKADSASSIPECDDYFARVDKCPPAIRSSMKQSADTLRRASQQVGANANARAALARSCRQLLTSLDATCKTGDATLPGDPLAGHPPTQPFARWPKEEPTPSPIVTTPPDPTPPAPPVSNGPGKLVAIAIGGSCAFAVDGSPKGSGSSIQVTVPLGSHTVSCTALGQTRRQSVNVVSGRPTVAKFKLN